MRQQNAFYKASTKKPATAKKQKKKKVAIPVQTPRVPPFGYVSPPEIPLHYQRMAVGVGVGVGVGGAGEKSMCRNVPYEFLFQFRRISVCIIVAS